jgi:hypothetical protein
MASKGRNLDYDFGAKRQWRRWLWNRVVERISCKPRDATVLYLSAREDHDRVVAKTHGFRDENLIAIDMDRGVVEDLRETGALAIAARIEEVLCQWNPKRNVHVVILDLCCGLEQNLFRRIYRGLLNPAFEDAVVAINVMRGREHDPVHEGKAVNWIASEWRPELNLSPLHRGAIWMSLIMPIGGIDCVGLEWMDAYNTYRTEAHMYRATCFDSVVYLNKPKITTDHARHIVEVDCRNAGLSETDIGYLLGHQMALMDVSDGLAEHIRKLYTTSRADTKAARALRSRIAAVVAHQTRRAA